MDKEKLLKQIKEKMSSLPDYSVGEEKLLVQYALSISKERLFLAQVFDNSEVKTIQRYLQRRLKGEPLNKIFKSQNFYGYNFYVNKNVLAPRKETEILVEEALRRIKKMSGAKVLDLCCGSGAIGLCICKESSAQVTLSDISPKALYVARRNAKSLDAKVKIIKRDMLKSNKNIYDVIVCNPPYIRSSDIISLDKGVRDYDPLLALDGGKDGLDFYRYLAENAFQNLNKKGVLLLEIGFEQYEDVKKLFEANNFSTWHLRDYSNCDRIVVVKRKGQQYD